MAYSKTSAWEEQPRKASPEILEYAHQTSRKPDFGQTSPWIAMKQAIVD
ncbi:MAG: hypothetical protein WA783_15490 [Phormidesmis sp.]